MTQTSPQSSGSRSTGTRSAVRGMLIAHRQGESVALAWADEARGSILAVRMASRAEAISLVAAAAQADERLLLVVPVERTVCRLAPLTGGGVAAGNSGLLAAARLLGEAQLPDAVAAHRRGVGVLRGEEGSQAMALLAGWLPESGAADELIAVAGPKARWCTVPGALAGIVGPGEAGTFADPSCGVIASLRVAGAGQGSAARVWREDSDDAVRWRAAIAEAAGSPGAARVDRVSLSLSPECEVRLTRAIGDAAATIEGGRREAVDRFGIAVAAWLVTRSGDELISGLADLRSRLPERVRPVSERTLDWLASPRRAIALAAAACVVMVTMPLGVAWARKEILDAKAAGLVDQKSSLAELDRKSALYRQLDTTRLPMTKIVAMVAAATPEEIVVSSVRLSPDQGLSVQGTAKKSEQIDLLQQNLNKTKIFSDVKITRRDTKPEGGVEFDVSADQVVNAHGAFKPLDDFAASTLAARMGIDKVAPAGTPPPARPSRRPGRSTGSDGAPDRGAGPRPSTDSAEPPAALTQDDIDKMDGGTAMKAWTSRQAFVQKNPKLDAAVKSRLQDEVAKLKARQTAARASGPGAGGGK